MYIYMADIVFTLGQPHISNKISLRIVIVM